MVGCIAVLLIACLGGAVASGWLSPHARPVTPAVAAETATSARATPTKTATPPSATPTGATRSAATTQHAASKTPAHVSAAPRRTASRAPSSVARSTSPQPQRPVRRDANGFALGGPPAPRGPANYEHPSHADCLRHLREVRAWSHYQNAHRPAGSTNYLPSSGDVQYLFVVCGLRY